MNRTLFGKEIKANLAVTGIITGVLAVYLAMVVSMFDPELGDSLATMMETMPELFAAFGMATQGTTLLDFLLNYLYGFLLTVLPFVLILIMVNKLVVRPIDRGTMAYLLATPTSRTTICLTLTGVIVTILAALTVVITALEIICSEIMFPGALDVEPLLHVNAGLFALWLFMTGICFLSACLFSHAGRALWIGGGLCILFFLLQMVAQVGEAFEFLKYVVPFSLFDPYGLVADEASAVARSLALGVWGLALLVVSIAVFRRRDLSI